MKFKIGEDVCVDAIGKIKGVKEVERYDLQLQKMVMVIRYTLHFNYTSGSKGFGEVEESLLAYPVGTGT